MSEQKKLQFEDEIKDLLIGDTQKDALDFTAFLRENKLSPEWHDSKTGWVIVYKSEIIATMGFINNELCIWFKSCDFGDSGSVDDELKETVWAHLCVRGENCADGKGCGCCFDGTIFEKKIENLCAFPLTFFNPDVKTLAIIKKLMLLLTKQS